MFLTAFSATLDLRSGACAYASGGHPPSWILRRSGREESLPPVRGPLVGMEAGRSFEERTITLEPGDLLVAYSDGVIEAEDQGQALYGEERPAGILSRIATADPIRVLEALRKDIGQFTAGAAQSDDVTLLAILYRNGPIDC